MAAVNMFENMERPTPPTVDVGDQLAAFTSAVDQLAQALHHLPAREAATPVVSVEAPAVSLHPIVEVAAPEITVPPAVVQVMDSKPKGATVTPRRDGDGYITSVEWVFHY